MASNLTQTLLEPILAADPAGPRITYYDDATGERVEVSAVTLANWAAKTANLLRDEFALDQGARVCVVDRDAASAEETTALIHAEGGEAVTLVGDVALEADVQRLFAQAHERTGQPISSVVNNALAQFQFDGDARPQIGDIAWARFAQQIDGAVKGALNTLQAALPGMRGQGFGRIVNVGTNLFQNPVVPYHDYTAAKAALLSLTRTAAHDLGPHGITVNMVSGGLLRTTDASRATPEAVFDLIASMTPLRRVTTPDEFADAALFFLSPWARAVTGQNLIVDSGLVKG